MADDSATYVAHPVDAGFALCTGSTTPAIGNYGCFAVDGSTATVTAQDFVNGPQAFVARFIDTVDGDVGDHVVVCSGSASIPVPEGATTLNVDIGDSERLPSQCPGSSLAVAGTISVAWS